MFETTGNILRLDGAVDSLVPRDAVIEELAGGFGFTEGPVWIRDGGYLLFSDIPNRAIMRWHEDGGVSVFRRPAGFTGAEPPPGPLAGPNGITLDRAGRLLVCEHGNRQLVRIEPDGSLTVLADRYQGRRLNSPNDVVCHSRGDIYFTDPPYGLADKEDDPQRELPHSGLYCLSGGKLRLLYTGVKRPNGLAFSPDEKHLYLANSDAARRMWLKFAVTAEGDLTEERVLLDVTGHPDAGNPDGMKVDEHGNLYCTGPGGVWILTSEGKHLGTIRPPEIPANCCWGDEDACTLYITARTGLYRIRLSVRGIRP